MLIMQTLCIYVNTRSEHFTNKHTPYRFIWFKFGSSEALTVPQKVAETTFSASGIWSVQPWKTKISFNSNETFSYFNLCWHTDLSFLLIVLHVSFHLYPCRQLMSAAWLILNILDLLQGYHYYLFEEVFGVQKKFKTKVVANFHMCSC